MTTGKTIALTRWTFVGKVMSLLFNMLPRLVITFLPRSKHILISWLQSSSVEGLPPDARIRVIANDDAAWTLEKILLADIRNHLAMILWALGSGKNRPKPALIGASWMRSDGRQKLEAQVMTVDELMTELRKPRRG